MDGGGESQQEGDASNSQPINQQEKQVSNSIILIIGGCDRFGVSVFEQASFLS